MSRQRGVALIIALVVVALATILATRIGAQGARDQRRAATLFALEQGWQVALGAEAWAIEILYDDAARTQKDSLDEVWATPLPPLPIDGGSVVGRLEDMQGRFNLNNLVNADGTKNPVAYAQFQRLLERLQLEPKWASLVLDWIDPDTLADGVDGAEDGVYTGQSPPYRTANAPITSTSELLALPGFGVERYRKLAPYVAALPVDTPLNTCTAPGLVLDTVAPGITQFSTDAKQLLANRQKGCFPTVADVKVAAQQAGMDAAEADALKLSESSKWFRATTLVSIGTTQLTLYSLLERNPGGYARVVLRSLGAE
jgi:general secretion pathway protein K